MGWSAYNFHNQQPSHQLHQQQPFYLKNNKEFQGSPHTWSNKRGGKANIRERLNRGFRFWPMPNGKPFPHYQNHPSACHTSSDHHLLFLDTNVTSAILPKPFKLEDFWFTDHSCLSSSTMHGTIS